jgi:four helix bundle protein
MTKIECFEDLNCWKNARELCKLIYKFTRNERFSKDYTLVNQIRGSSGSGMDNIAEGFERGGNKEFIQFLSISNGSLAEVKSQLFRALDQDYINEKEFQQASALADKTGKENTNLILYLKKSDMKGYKFS